MDDQVLLAQYVATCNAGAFEELTRRYGGLVKGVCHRVLGNSHDAEEVAQECFLELARDASQVHSSVAGWLHRAATTRSLNALRSRSRRKVREREVVVATETTSTLADVTTRELRRVIDGALTAMPDDLRLPMILHFLDGRSQRDVALQLGVNQSTISRRMRDALRQLRERLTQGGYAASVPALMVAMQNQAEAVPDSALVTLAVAGTASKAAGGTTIAAVIKGTAATLLPMLSFFLLGGWITLLVAVSVAVYVAQFRPLWVPELFSSLGVKDVYNQPTFCLARWDWDTPPPDWRVRVQTSLVWSVAFLCLSLVFALGTRQPPWGIVILGAITAGGFVIHAGRIIHRVNRATQVSKITHPAAFNVDREGEFWGQLFGFSSNDPTLTWFDAVQLIAIGQAALLIAVQVIVRPQSATVWPSVVLSGMIGATMVNWGVCLCRRLKTLRGKPQAVAWSFSRRIAGRVPQEDTDGSPQPHQTEGYSQGIQGLMAVGATVVATLSFWIAWNPSAVGGASLSLAAVQTSMLGWLVYRLVARCQGIELKFARRAVVAILVGCLVLNSSVCLASWLR